LNAPRQAAPVKLVTPGCGLAGAGWLQVRGGPGAPLTAGDTAHIPAGEEHWHGGTASTAMLHLAVSIGATDWLDEVSSEDYEAALEDAG
jgi:hypothetical protein